MPKKPEKPRSADRHQADDDRRRDADGRIAPRCARTQHGNADIIASANRNKSLSPVTSLPIEETRIADAHEAEQEQHGEYRR
jgi:hypothetical protein